MANDDFEEGEAIEVAGETGEEGENTEDESDVAEDEDE
jgi:ribosomal protein S28E/S33